MKHTPGPWGINLNEHSATITHEGGSIAAVWPDTLNGRHLPMAANACLIAAAPEMYEALKALVAQILDYERVNNLSPNPGRKYCWNNTARAVAAIAKAEGTAVERDLTEASNG